MRFDVAFDGCGIFKLPLDQKISAVRVIRILLGFEHGLVVIAIAEGGSGYVVSAKVHASLQLHNRFKKAYRDPVDLKPRHRGSDTAHMRRTARGFLVVEVDRKHRRGLQSIVTRSCPSRQQRRTAEMC